MPLSTFYNFVAENNTMKRCDGSYKSGRSVHVDFDQIKHPCTCTLKALFNGDILVTAKTNGYYECRNQVTVSLDTTSIVFNCKSTYPSAVSFYNVVKNETIVNVKAEYIQSYTSGDFPVCLGINANDGNVYVSYLKFITSSIVLVQGLPYHQYI